MSTQISQITKEALDRLLTYPDIEKISLKTIEGEWEAAVNKVTTSSTLPDKKCPKETCCTICLSGELKGLNFQKDLLDGENANYARELIRLLKTGKYSKDNRQELWEKVLLKRGKNKTLKHNGQTDVALVFYELGYI